MLQTILFAAVGGVFIILLGITIMFPRYYARFGKFLWRSITRSLGRPTLTPEQEEAKAKAKKLVPFMPIATKIEQLVPGQIVRFMIAREQWGADLLNVEINPEHPQGGRKYIVSTENVERGIPDGKRTRMYDSDNPVEIAASILDRNGKLVASTEQTNATSAEKVIAGTKQ
jgi:hypothetical protein